MTTRPRYLISFVLLLVAQGLAACGGGNDTAVVVARVDGSPISRSTLSHWMSVIVAGDNFEHVGRPAPKGLVADPPDNQACIAAIKTIGPPTANAGQSGSSGMAPNSQCRALYDSIKRQTLSFLIQGMWAEKEGEAAGVKATDQEVVQRLDKTKAERYPTESAFKRFLTDSGLTLSDELVLIKQSVQSERLEAQRRSTLGKRAKGGEALAHALLAAYAETIKRRLARTKCSVGYLVPECRGYKAPATVGPAPAVVLEQIAASRRARPH